MTKRRTIMGFGGALLAGALLFEAGASYGQSEREMHPRLSAAITSLQDARAYLNAAPHDFGGHKASAIQAIDAALTELREALRYRGERR